MGDAEVFDYPSSYRYRPADCLARGRYPEVVFDGSGAEESVAVDRVLEWQTLVFPDGRERRVPQVVETVPEARYLVRTVRTLHAVSFARLPAAGLHLSVHQADVVFDGDTGARIDP